MSMFLVLLLTAFAFLLSQVETELPPVDEVAAVKHRLSRLQHQSFSTNREYCGYLGRMPDGTVLLTHTERGGHSGCTPTMTDPDVTWVASFHTHGAYDSKVPAEFPSTLDMDSDAREGVNGYVSTPGGRLWFIDSQRQVAIQLCGIGCLPKDPDFHAGDDGLVRRVYTRQQLSRLETN